MQWFWSALAAGGGSSWESWRHLTLLLQQLGHPCHSNIFIIIIQSISLFPERRTFRFLWPFEPHVLVKLFYTKLESPSRLPARNTSTCCPCLNSCSVATFVSNDNLLCMFPSNGDWILPAASSWTSRIFSSTCDRNRSGLIVEGLIYQRISCLHSILLWASASGQLMIITVFSLIS